MIVAALQEMGPQPSTFNLSPRNLERGKAGEGCERDPPTYAIEREFAAFPSPSRSSRRTLEIETSFHQLSTPPKAGHEGSELVSDEESGDEEALDGNSELAGKLRIARRRTETQSFALTPPTHSTEFAIEDEFAALTAAQALHQMGPGRQEAESAWRMCLLREKLKCLQRGKQRPRGFSWAPALARLNQVDNEAPGADGETSEVTSPHVDVDVWPRIAEDDVDDEALDGGPRAAGELPSPSESRRGRAPTSPAAWDPLFDFEEMDLLELRRRQLSETPRPVPKPPQRQQCQVAPQGCDLFFHFGDIDEAEREQQEMLTNILKAWAALVRDA
mmetsp:Transcript_100303/g.255200  ORF Transcript_100303/g.255200 Transcript_100303/m.255200 type:complete len:331 (+) Transcript_100303:73-1065(+)